MPVFNSRHRDEEKMSAGLAIDLQELIEEVRRQLKTFRNFDVDWISEYLEDKETDLLLDPTISEYEEIRDNVELIQSKLEEIMEDYDLEDDAEDIQEELDDLEDDID